MLRVDRVVELRDDLVFILIRNQTIECATTSIRRHRKCLRDGHGHLIQFGGVNLVVHKTETCRQISLSPIVTSRRGEAGEIPCQCGGRRDEGGVLDAVGSKRCPLVTAEKEHFVLLDRTAEDASKLIPFVSVAFCRERVAGIEFVIPYELKQIAVEIVAARTRYSIDRCSCVESVLRLHSAGLHFEFLESVREWQRHAQTVIRILPDRTIQ